MKIRHRHARIRRTRRQRGAVLVEAAVVMPVLVIFLGLTMFVHKEYMAKQETMTDTRHAAFSKALHGGNGDCNGSGNIGNGIPVLQDVTKYVPILAPVKAALESLVSTDDEASTRTGSWKGRSRTVSSQSYLYCTPKSYGNVWDIASSAVTTALGWAKSLIF